MIDSDLLDLDQRNNADIMQLLLDSQRQAVVAVENARSALEKAIQAAVEKLMRSEGRLVLAGAGASGRLAVQDGAEMWPTYGWPEERLVLCMAGGQLALLKSVEGVEDSAEDAKHQVEALSLTSEDVVLALAASGRSPWTCAFLEHSRVQGATTIGISNNPDTPLLALAQFPVFLDSGSEVLAGSTRMAAGTAQKIALNVFSTTLMIRLNRTYGNLMVDMAAVNHKLDDRRLRMLQTIDPSLSDDHGKDALVQAGGWVKLASLLALGLEHEAAKTLLEKHQGSLRAALATLKTDENGTN